MIYGYGLFCILRRGLYAFVWRVAREIIGLFWDIFKVMDGLLL
jgi:hypothetical protein